MTSALPARAPRLRGARALFTGRAGGAGTGDYATLNLARYVGDEDGVVDRNRALLAAEIGAPLVFTEQVHSPDVHVLPEHGPVPVITADALVTRRSDVALAIMVADCLPVLLSDETAGVIAVSHAGRAGLLGGVLENTLAAMAELGAVAEQISASIGPSICGSCYEVPEEMRADSSLVLPATWSLTRWGTPALDLRAGAVSVLTGAGIPAAEIDVDHTCTLECEDFFSYRRQARTGRFAGVVRRR